MTDRETARTRPRQPVGVSVPRRDGVGKVTGSAQYTGDMTLPGMCHAAILRSPYPHARIIAIETEAARGAPRIVAVVTAADLPDVDLVYGHSVADHPLIATGKVRFAGEPVAAVIAEDLTSATQALDLIRVEYEPLPFVTEVDEAVGPEAPLIHERPGEQRPHRGFAEDVRRNAPNVCSQSRQAWGDVRHEMSQAAVTIQSTFRYPMAYAYAMEPYTAIADFRDRNLTVWTSAQHPFMVREDLAQCFGLPLSAVRVVVPYVGGGYGSKSYTKIEPLAAALSLRAQRPVKLALSVEESILTTRGDSAVVELRSGFDANGLLLAREAKVWLNTGAYAENSPLVARKAANRLGGPYRIPALDVEAICVYTNTAPASSFRGFGAPQVVLAGESQMDEAAAKLKLDSLEIRRRNVLRRGERPWAGVRALDADLAADLDLVAEALDWGSPVPEGRGRGLAISASDAGSEPVTTAIVRVLYDGSVIVGTGSTEIGQGSSTVLAQIAAAELGVDLGLVRLNQSDTEAVTYDRSTGASRTTTLMGLAVQRAAHDVRRQLQDWAAEAMALDGRAVEEIEDGVRIGSRRIGWGEIVRAWFGGAAGEVIGRGYVRRQGETEEMPPFWEIGCVGVEVTVDRDTGEIRLDRLVTVGDVGRAINPRMVEGQDIGAATMGMGLALREELIYQNGNLVNGNLFDYRVPRSTDLPRLTPIVVERADGVGPYGAKGGGEGALNPIAPAIASAVWQAIGIRLREAPFTPERVWNALNVRAKDGGESGGTDA